MQHDSTSCLRCEAVFVEIVFRSGHSYVHEDVHWCDKFKLKFHGGKVWSHWSVFIKRMRYTVNYGH